ncbi:hypothetical protein SAMN02982989_3438 [Xaviernesmea oryzae]|uniref:Lysozyme n=1 Tax=Xaviernesmea oryzae TaxID=464029 RepID=A0A1X7G910_9HYPH|nr:hypothetical protein [Xaviernesmea oryzae]SMF66113.1 hypothetical protein SAMN02982989_3438 [Xaviernesmea oryzae]
MDKYYVYRPMLDLIGFTEGTDKGDGYNETLAYGAYTGGDVDLVSMTLAELDALQTKMLKHPKNALNSSACGRYQIVRTTARNIRKDLPDRYPTTRKFDKDCQDEMACYLLGQRGIDKYLAGRLSEDTLIDNLAKEWASLPTTAGKGHYGGQHAAVTTLKVRSVLAEVKRRHAEGQPIEKIEVPVEKPVPVPVTPPSLEKPWWQSKEVVGPVLTGGIFGGIGTFFEKFGGIPFENLALLLVAGVVALVAVLLFLRRRDQKAVAKQVGGMG